MLTVGVPEMDPASQTLNEQIALSIYPNAEKNKRAIRRLADNPGEYGNNIAKLFTIGITQAGVKGVPFYLTEKACAKVAEVLPTLADWTYTEESIPAPYGFCRLATPIKLPVPPGQVPPMMTAFAWFQYSGSEDGPNKLLLNEEIPAGLKTHEQIGVVLLHETEEAPHGVPKYALSYRLDRSLYEHTNSLAQQNDPMFYPLDFRNRYIATVFALLQQKQLHTEQREANPMILAMFADWLKDIHRDGYVTIVDTLPEPETEPGSEWQLAAKQYYESVAKAKLLTEPEVVTKPEPEPQPEPKRKRWFWSRG